MNGYVVARLQGGMGNQMFEYAFACALSLRGGMDIFIDTAGLNPKKHSGFSLDRFEISAKFVDKDRKNAVITPHFELKRRLYKALKIPYRLSASHIREKSFGFEPTYRQIKASCYLEGLWQSEKYFSDFSAQISAEFKLKDEESLMRHPLFEQIKNSNSVAVHVRRREQGGDVIARAVRLGVGRRVEGVGCRVNHRRVAVCGHRRPKMGSRKLCRQKHHFYRAFGAL